MNNDKGTLKITVHDGSGRKAPIKGALIQVHATHNQEATTNDPIAQAETDANGQTQFELEAGVYSVDVETFLKVEAQTPTVKIGEAAQIDFHIPIGFQFEVIPCRENAAQDACPDLIPSGTQVRARVAVDEIDKKGTTFRKPVKFEITSTRGSILMTGEREAVLDTSGLTGPVTLSGTVSEVNSSSMTVAESLNVIPRGAQPVSGNLSISLNRTGNVLTADMPLWTVIRAGSAALSFNNYKKFIDAVMCGREPFGDYGTDIDCSKRSLPFPGVHAYSMVKCATEIFLMTHCGVALEDFGLLALNLIEEKSRYGQEVTQSQLNQLWDAYLVEVNGGNPVRTLPFLALIRSRLGDVPIKDSLGTGNGQAEVANCFGILRNKLERPCLIELIWSYWHEEGMLVQTMKAISMRFQNKRGSAAVEPLMRFDIDPLRPLNNLIWGYIQDEQHRLTILRRAYEYDHHYGITLQGRAVPALRPVDGRSKFLEALHNLLYLSAVFFKEDDDTTVHPDAFPVMNAIREVHLLLAEGAHNQYGDLPSTARQEMLIEQWLLARPEMREFLGGRLMVPYPEPWMDRVDAVKKIQGWTDINISEFNSLAVFGEQLLLSIRYGHWTGVHDPAQAANWARYWRPEIQGYIHSYRSVTGVDLTQEATESRQVSQRDAQPSIHLRRRLDQQLASRR
jgi:hypothetical protein